MSKSPCGHPRPSSRGPQRFGLGPNSRYPGAAMDVTGLRICLFTGNYNYTRDGANQALNRLVAYLIKKGAAVRIYSPTVEEPAFPPNGEVVDIPSLPVPGRSEYRMPVAPPPRPPRAIGAFRPNIFHVARPDLLGPRAVTFANRLDLPVVASVHPRFETY